MARKSIGIIGAGLAGLSAGCYAQMNGYRCTIFEHHSSPGGVAAAWRRGEYLIDGGIHFLMGHRPGSAYYRMYQELGIAQANEFVDMTMYGRFVDEPSGKTLDITPDLDKLERDLKGLFPLDAEVVDRLLAGVRKMLGSPMMGSEEPGLPQELMGPLDKLRQLWRMRGIIRYFGGDYAKPIAHNPLKAKDPLFRRILENVFLPEAPPWFIMMLLALLANRQMGLLPGGCPDFVNPMEARFRRLGGQIRYDAKVTRILVENDVAVGVRLENGEEHRADIVVSAADGYSTIFQMLDGRYVDEEIERRYREWALCRPVLMISFGVAKSFDGEPATNLFILKEPMKTGAQETKGMHVRIFNYGKEFAPAGKTVVQVLIETEWSHWSELAKDRGRYEAEKERLAKEALVRLEKHWPGITEKIEITDVATPNTWWRYTLNRQGSYMGWLPAADKLLKSIPRTLPGLCNFYTAGQWVTPGGSVPTSLASGRELVQILCDNDGKEFIASVA